MFWCRCVLSCMPSPPIATGPAAHILRVMQGRYLSIICWDGKLHCLDSSCCHAGGPLVCWLLNQLLISWLHVPCFMCMHNVCSRLGGHASGAYDLQALGDIEVIEARACLTCPWHYSKISLETGEHQPQEGRRHSASRLAALRQLPRLCR